MDARVHVCIAAKSPDNFSIQSESTLTATRADRAQCPMMCDSRINHVRARLEGIYSCRNRINDLRAQIRVHLRVKKGRNVHSNAMKITAYARFNGLFLFIAKRPTCYRARV